MSRHSTRGNTAFSRDQERTRKQDRNRRAARRLLVEQLEDRRLLTVFGVTRFDDPAPGMCDSGDCSLREAIIAANESAEPDTINLPAGTYNLTIAGSSENAAATGDLDITDTDAEMDRTTTISGAGAATTIIDATGLVDRVFHVLSGASAEFASVTITGGSGQEWGGGIYNYDGTVKITNSTISGNSATDDGGGVYNGGYYWGTVTITNSTISGNSASYDGGGIWSYGTATISDSTISGNTANVDGGGIYNWDGTVTITNSTISGNIADLGYGGGIYNRGTATITQSTISGNSSDRKGGGIYNRGSEGPPGMATITNSTISGNSSATDGGGVYNGSGTVTITNSTISGNSAVGNGGGIYNDDTLAITNSTISGNLAEGNGGGIYNRDTATITNSTISGNLAEGNGGGIYGFYYDSFDHADATINNTIITNSGTGGDFNIPAGWSGSNNLTDDAGFPGSLDAVTNFDEVLADNGGPTWTHALLAGSNAIDFGGNGLAVDALGDPLTTDQRGDTRIVNGQVDIGAFEVQESQPLAAVLDSSGHLTINDIDALGKDNQLTISLSGSYLVISDDSFAFTGESEPDTGGELSPDSQTLTVLFSTVTGLTFNGYGGDDTLAVDFSGGNPIPSGGITFNGGDPTNGPGDKLVVQGNVTGTPFTNINYDVTAPGAGTLTFASPAAVINFTGLEPATITSLAGTVTIDIDNTGPDAFGPITTTILDAVGANMTAAFDVGAEDLTFATPTVALILLGDNTGDDTFIVASVDTNLPFAGSLTINGQGGTDSVTVNANLSFASGRNFSATAETIDINNPVSTQGAGTILLDGTSLVTVDATLTTASGTATLNADNGTVDINAVVSSTSGAILITGNIITQDANVTTGSTATVVVTADSGSITMANGTTTSTGSGQITYSATTGVAFSALSTTGNVIVTADSDNNGSGAITDNLTSNENPNITGNQVALRAGSGIGSGVAPNDADIDVAISRLAAVTASGDIHVQDLGGGLDINTVNGLSGVTITNSDGLATGNDDITIRASGLLFVRAGNRVRDLDGGDITLAAEGNTSAADLTINADITAQGDSGSISLYAGDTISLNTAHTASAALAGAILAMAGTNYNNGTPLNGTNAGNVVMSDGSTMESIRGNITVLAPGDVILSILDADSNANGIAGDVIVTADYGGVGGVLSNNIGAISDNLTGEGANIRGALVTLQAATGIGSGGGDADIETNVTTINALNLTSGDIAINEVAAGFDLNVQQATQSSTTGSISLSTELGNLTVLAVGSGVRLTNAANAAGTISLDANVTLPGTDEPVPRGNAVVDQVVTSQGGAITITADHDVTGAASGAITSNGGAIGITADANNSGLGGNNDGTIQLSGDITAGGGSVTFSLTDCDGWLGATAPTTNGEIVSALNINKYGLGTLRLNGASNNYTGQTTVYDGALIVNGTLTDSTPAVGGVVVTDNALLGGGDGVTTGTINAYITVQLGGILDPGDLNPADCSDPNPGQLTVTGNITMAIGSTFRVQLDGLTAGSGYDQLVLHGLINIAGNDFGNPTAGANLEVTAGASMPVGAEYTIIVYDPGDLIDQRFRDTFNSGATLGEGGFFTTGGTGNLMNISYYTKSDNNDVTLTHPGRYDFNGFNGYTAQNYAPISPFQSKAGNSAGWLTLPPQWFERNYPVTPPYMNADPILQAEQRLRYDGQATDTLGNPLTFEVDVVAGKQYEVMILTGDSTWNHDKQQFQVYDGSLPAPPLTPVDLLNLPSNTQIVNTWGAGAPEGGANIISGGGTANPSGTTGYYRWIRFTTDSIIDSAPVALDGLGTLRMTMRDLGGGDPATVILGMDIRPVETVGKLTITRTGPLPLPTAPLEADGLAVDTYSGSGAPPGATLTVTVSAGSPTVQYAAVTPDGDTTMFGGQVTANSSGVFTFSVLRPAKLAGTASSESWTILAQERSGLSRGTLTQQYKTATDTKPLRFDFGDYNSPVAAGFLQVEPRTTYSGTRGYGWTTRVASKTRIDTVNPLASTDLRRDFNYSRNGVFRVDLAANTPYNVRLYHANPRNGTTPFVQGEFDLYTNINSAYSAATSVHVSQYPVMGVAPGSTEIRTFSVTTGSSGVLYLDFRSLGSFLVSGIDISTGGLPVEQQLLAAGDPLDGGAAAISQDMLQPVAAEAAARWSDLGLTPAQTATLSNVQFAVADLGGAYLGLANSATNQIRIDNDAAMLGWSLVTGPSSFGNGRRTSDNGQMTSDGVDLLTVVMHEMGHLLGYQHNDDADSLMAPVLGSGMSRASSVPNFLSLNLSPLSPAGRPSSDRSAKAFEPLGQADWRMEPSSFALRPSSSGEDDVFAELGRNDRTAQDSSEETSSELLESADGGLLAARTAKSGEEATQARVPRRSRMQRYERELDAWFAELVAEEAVGG